MWPKHCTCMWYAWPPTPHIVDGFLCMLSKVKVSRYSLPCAGIAPHTHLNLVWLGDNSIMPRSVYPWDREPRTQWIGWVGSKTDIGIFEEEKNSNEMKQNIVHSTWHCSMAHFGRGKVEFNNLSVSILIAYIRNSSALFDYSLLDLRNVLFSISTTAVLNLELRRRSTC